MGASIKESKEIFTVHHKDWKWNKEVVAQPTSNLN